MPHLGSSCLGLSFAIYVYVLSAIYFNADLIANLEKDIELTVKIEINCSKHRTYLKLTWY